MTQINPHKLLNSKWTAAHPTRKEKHFLVVDVEYDEQGNVIDCIIEAVMTGRAFSVEWKELKDTKQWLQGWRK